VMSRRNFEVGFLYDDCKVMSMLLLSLAGKNFSSLG